MNRVARRFSIGVGIFIGLIALGIVCMSLFFDINRYKPQIEADVAKSTGMNLKIQGKISLKILPHVRIAMRDVHLSNHGSELFVVSAVEATPQFFPFIFRRELIVNHISLEDPRLQIVKNRSGEVNFATKHGTKDAGNNSGHASNLPSRVKSISIRNGELTYLDRTTGKKVEVKGVNANFLRISWDQESGESHAARALVKSIILHGNLQAHSLKVEPLTVSNIKFEIKNDHGLIHFDPTEATAFGGPIRGNAQIDLRGSTPKMKIAQVASHIDLAQFPSAASAQISGVAKATIDLMATGNNVKTITKWAKGNISIHSQDVTLTGVDVDDLAGKLKTSQSLDLVHIGSQIFSGPLAPTLGKAEGRTASAHQKKSVIRNLVSDWTIDSGIAKAKDVAFSTSKTTIAFSGNINLINKTYQNFFVASVDQEGCTKNKVEIVGPLNHPRPTAGSVGEQISRSYAGQAGSIIGGIFSGKKDEPTSNSESSAKEAPNGCDRFYSGAIAKMDHK